ncbi:acyl carrier protein [Streptomyces albireticuli]|uniref:Polyketide-8 synthase acyl carrier protein n=1 Tax=Streptomyces albireticuli TaxID=1940 RepID=A0A2A2D9Z4_9ACTN|nr:phosphopantetheine-binding protein [Streptomyces albireticuli]MCD9140967.1 phosphopantetheine-binding protein [Streptomyces albireticuli]MCD9161071.1 phosphopantetheine-binding protein [Streptomyces albireticuli]MCD9190871.1 phosphopantetheine-binding protein [Streptomyces albireticuli]PAU48301.1 polyketide-8 synthase acyl carrier protein [Streptomyces albireticuli]
MNPDSSVIDLEKLRVTIAETLELEPAEVTDDAHFVRDLGADSLLALEMQVVLEEQYDVRLTEDDLRAASTLLAAHALLVAKAAARTADAEARAGQRIDTSATNG